MFPRTDLRAATTVVALIMLLSGSPSAAGNDIVETASAAGDFETLVAAVKTAGLAEVLQGEGPFTVFAPTDDAFAALPDGAVEDLLRPENRDRLVDLLTDHVIAGEIPAEIAVTLDKGETLSGRSVEFEFDGETLMVDDATVVAADVRASNGVIHVIDRVLVPGDDERRVRAAQRLIERAIDRGAPLYNHGQRAACAAIYMTATDGLLMGGALPQDAAENLRRARWRAGNSSDPDNRAWIMRRALDSVHGELSGTRLAAD